MNAVSASVARKVSVVAGFRHDAAGHGAVGVLGQGSDGPATLFCRTAGFILHQGVALLQQKLLDRSFV